VVLLQHLAHQLLVASILGGEVGDLADALVPQRVIDAGQISARIDVLCSLIEPLHDQREVAGGMAQTSSTCQNSKKPARSTFASFRRRSICAHWSALNFTAAFAV